MPTKIEWTDETWNPITGCSPVSAGCERCYAQRMSKRLAGRYGYPADEPFRVTYQPGRLDEPLAWKKSRMVFVCSMGDLFHEKVAFPYINRVFARIAMAPQHTFQILTKRPDRMLEYMTAENRIPGIADNIHWHPEWRKKHNCDVGNIKWPLSNVWCGTSVEDQGQYHRAVTLLQVPAAVRFVSAEPLLGALNLEADCLLEYLDWVIVGGESGAGARPMHPRWALDVRDQCVEAGVPFLFKQWGNWAPVQHVGRDGKRYLDISSSGKNDILLREPSYINMKRVGKKAAGRNLDGREWNEYPE